MRFRPCIDIHNGKVKQIVGSSLVDEGDYARENYISEHDAVWFSKFYYRDGLTGGHIILLNPESSSMRLATKRQGLEALRAVPGIYQLGGAVTPYNAAEYLDAGATHVIVTTYVFQEGQVNWGHLENISGEVGRDHLVLDLSCRLKNGKYYVVTDRWQNFTDVELTKKTLEEFSRFCSEFLVHAVDSEGKRRGPNLQLADILSASPIPVTYAGGIRSFKDIDDLREHGRGKLDVTIGSALDIFGGNMSYREILKKLDH